eukprot:4425613-Prymnesium_polylepis.3
MCGARRAKTAYTLLGIPTQPHISVWVSDACSAASLFPQVTAQPSASASPIQSNGNAGSDASNTPGHHGGEPGFIAWRGLRWSCDGRPCTQQQSQ